MPDAAGRRRTRLWWGSLALALFALGFSLALAEVALRIVFPEETRYYVIRPGMETGFRPDPALLQGLSPETRFTTNRDGMRGRPYDDSTAEYRILAVGGSTTESAYLDDGETWTALLEERLRRGPPGRPTWVGNVGRSGLNTRDHVVEARHLLPQFSGVDAMVVLTGVNDLTVALAEGDRYVLPPPITLDSVQEEHARRAFVMTPGRLASPTSEYMLARGAPWYKRMALWQVARRVRLRANDAIRLAGLNQDRHGANVGRWRANRWGASGWRDGLPDLAQPLAEYRASLSALIAIARERDVRLVLVTQPALWRPDLTSSEDSLLWLGGTGNFMNEPGHVYYRPAHLAQAMTAFNEVMRELCREQQVECIDLARELAATTEHFYDDVHFTVKGAARIAEILAAYFASHPPYHPAEVP